MERKYRHETYRVSTSRSSSTFSVVVSSSSISASLARVNLAFNGIKTIFKRLEQKFYKQWDIESKKLLNIVNENLYIHFLNLQCLAIHGVLCHIQSHHAHLSRLSHACKVIKTSRCFVSTLEEFLPVDHLFCLIRTNYKIISSTYI